MKKYLLAVLVGTLSSPAFAADKASFDVDAHVSTLGYGLGVAFPMTDTIAGRLGFNKFNKSFNKTSNSVNYTGDLKLSSFEALADWHLFNGVTHLTAGLMHNGNKFAMDSTGSYTINGNPYSATLTSTVEFNKVAPYLGFGWSGQARNTGFSFKSDFGVLFQGKPKSTVTDASGTVPASDLATAQADLDNELKNFKYYPVISFGIGYAF